MTTRGRNPLIPDNCYRVELTDRSPRLAPVSKVVLHCSGGGIVQDALDTIFGPQLSPQELHRITMDPGESFKVTEHVAHFYAQKNGVSTGFVAGWCGEVIQTMDENFRAWSAGIKANIVALYKKGYAHWSKFRLDKGVLIAAPTGYYKFWEAMYNEARGLPPDHGVPASASPLEFNGGDHGPDHVSISVDFVTPPYQRRDGRGIRCLGPTSPNYPAGALYTLAQVDSVARLVRNFSEYYPDMRKDRAHVMPHSFTSPIERTRCERVNGKLIGYGYDPGEALDWRTLLA